MKIFKDGKQRDATPDEEAAILAQQEIDSAPHVPTPEEIDAARRTEYTTTADPLLAEFLAEKFANDPKAKPWLDAREAVKQRHPKTQVASKAK